MDDEQPVGSMPGMMLPIGPIILILIVFLILRKRRKSRDERQLSRIERMIDDSELPDRAKEMLLQRVDEVRGGLVALREMAAEIRKD